MGILIGSLLSAAIDAPETETRAANKVGAKTLRSLEFIEFIQISSTLKTVYHPSFLK
jgi:hypothetical protein